MGSSFSVSSFGVFDGGKKTNRKNLSSCDFKSVNQLGNLRLYRSASTSDDNVIYQPAPNSFQEWTTFEAKTAAFFENKSEFFCFF